MTALSGASAADADPIPAESLSPRSVGRAGVGLVSDDSGLAVLSNPAAIARRGQIRIAVGLRLADDDTTINPAAGSSPEISDASGANASPAIGVSVGIGRRWLIGAAFTEGRYERRYAKPQFGQRPEDVATFFPTRYAGLAAASSTRSFAIGASLRATDWIAVGVSVGVDSIEIESTRSIWAGFSGREPVGDPAKDLLLTLRADALVVPRAAIGALIAPIGAPFEVAVAATARPPSTLEGEALASAMTAEGSPPTTSGIATATLPRPGVATFAVGFRYLGQRLVLEVGASAARYFRREAAKRWRVSGLTVTDESGAEGELDRVLVLLATRPHFRVGGSVDVAVIEGFLWLTAGYAIRSAAIADAERNPLLAAPTTHLAAVGAEAVWSNFTVTLGVSRAFAGSRRVTDSTAVSIVNPFGESAGTGPAGAGSYTQSADRGALTVEYAF